MGPIRTMPPMTSTRHTRHPSGTSPLVRQLVDEWTHLCTRPRSVRSVNQWGIGEPVDHLDEVLTKAGYGGARTDSQCDRYLLELVRRAATDELAARIVLQRILPPLIAVAARRGRINPGGFNESFSLVLSHAWIRIRTYPVERRPAKVAANLVLDTEYHAYVRDARMKQVRTVGLTDTLATMLAAPEPTPDVAEELAELVEELHQLGLPERTTVVFERACRGESAEDIAADLGVSVRSVRTWRREAINALRERMRSAA